MKIVLPLVECKTPYIKLLNVDFIVASQNIFVIEYHLKLKIVVLGKNCTAQYEFKENKSFLEYFIIDKLNG